MSLVGLAKEQVGALSPGVRIGPFYTAFPERWLWHRQPLIDCRGPSAGGLEVPSPLRK